MNEKTLVVIKPDAMQRGIMGEIISRYEKVGLKVIGAKMLKVPKELADKHYPKDRDDFITGMGQKTLNSYKDQGLDPIKELGTDDPRDIGLKIQGWLVEFISESPVMALVLEGPHAIEVVRKLTGFTLPSKADPGTIRGDYSFDSSAYANTAKRPIRNLIHASGDAEEAEFEISLWFKPEELYEYDAIHHKHMTQ
jgi:nucleoside-diphosphate kinase